jgi:SAM-dependent methyltransferase
MSAARWQRPCPACGGREAAALHFNRMAPLDGLDLSYRVARCARCRFAFADELPSPETYQRYYRTLSKYDAFDSDAQLPPAYRARARAARELCARHVGREASVVDLGCGPGVLLDELRAAGWEDVRGFDPAPHAAQQALRLYGLENVRSGSLGDPAVGDALAAAGLVCLTGILEHLPRLREDLAALLERLPASAHVLVEVPALERFLEPSFEPFGEFSLEHVQYFSAATLARLFASLGYRALALELLPLPAGTTDSLLGLFVRAENAAAPAPAEDGLIEAYVQRSAQACALALSRIEACAAGRLLVYGAGSHTARLLPALLERGFERRIAGVADANPNLAGKAIGPFTIRPPEALGEDPAATVIVSTFRSQEAVAAALARRFPNPLLRLY